MLPKILVIGKENVAPNPKQSMAKNITADELIENTPSFMELKNQHYRRTYATLLMLINPKEYKNYVEKGFLDKTFNYDGLTNQNLHNYFALTNYYHCVFHNDSLKRHNIKTSKTMSDNCAKIVKCEIDELEPDVVILQDGWWIKKSIKLSERLEWLDKFYDSNYSIDSPEIDGNKNSGIFIITNKKTDKKVYFIGSYHPCFPRWRNPEYLVPLQNRLEYVHNQFYK